MTEAPLPGPGRPGSRPPTAHTGPPAAPAPAAPTCRASARPTQSVRSGETAAGAWERAAPARVGLRRRSPPGRTGPGSRERGRGGRRKWGRGGGHTLSPLARRSRGAPSGAKARTSRSGEKFPTRILPPRAQPASSRPSAAARAPGSARSARSAPLAAPRCQRRPAAGTRAGARADSGLPAHAHLLLWDSRSPEAPKQPARTRTPAPSAKRAR